MEQLVPARDLPAHSDMGSLKNALPQVVGLAAIALIQNFPIVAFAVSALLLINLPRDHPPALRRVLGLLMAVSVAMMMASLPVAQDSSWDIIGYHDLYEEYRNGDLERLFQFGAGYEIALPFLFYFWGLILPPLSLNGLMLCLTLTSAVLFWGWVELTFYGKRNRESDFVLMGAALLLFNVFFAAQLSRQFLSAIVLLYAMSATTTTRKAFFVLLAASCHLTALPLYGAYLLVRRGPWGVITLVLLALGLRWYFPTLLAVFDILPEAAIEKLFYYVDNTSEFTESDVGSLRLVGLLAIISLISLVAHRFKLSRAERAWHAIPWVTGLIQVILLPIPLVSLRAALIVHSVVTGLVAYQIITPYRRTLMRSVLNVLVLYKLAGFAMLEGGAGLQSTFGVVANAFQ